MKALLFRVARWIRGEILTVPGRIIGVVFLLALLVAPLVLDNPYYLRVLTLAAIFALYAASWDFLSGVTGQLNLGQGLFFGVAAYVAVLLNTRLDLSPWATIPIGAVAAVAVGLIAGIPALRLRGFYLGLVTMAFPTIVAGLLYVMPELSGGELGLSGAAPLTDSRALRYYVVIAVVAVSVLILWKLADPKSRIVRLGVILHAIKADEITARASGIDTTRYKLVAFAVSGLFAGIAGGLYAHFMRVATPSSFELSFSLQPILWTIFGGAGTIFGAVAGAFILFPLTELVGLHPIGEHLRLIVSAGLLIVTLLYMPEGICIWALDRLETRCPRCRVVNFSTRSVCRACDSPLDLRAGASEGQDQ